MQKKMMACLLSEGKVQQNEMLGSHFLLCFTIQKNTELCIKSTPSGHASAKLCHIKTHHIILESEQKRTVTQTAGLNPFPVLQSFLINQKTPENYAVSLLLQLSLFLWWVRRRGRWIK